MVSVRLFLLAGLIVIATGAQIDNSFFLSSILRQRETETEPAASAEAVAESEAGHSKDKVNGTEHHADTPFIMNEAFNSSDKIDCNASTPCADACECSGMGFCYAKARDSDIHDCHCVNNACPDEGDTCTDELCPSCVSRLDLKSVATCVKAANPPCVSTAWLESRGVAHATLRAAGSAPVLCIPGSSLPCGTAGHLLRDGSTLVTYREVCEKRSDCVESTMDVSQLSHTFDWSVYQADGLELTSLSAHPTSSTTSPSRVIANVADTLNRAGLGALTNAVAGLMNSEKLVPAALCTASTAA